MEISSAQLTAGYSHAKFFYTGPDGAMVFWSPVTGARTENTSYARSELREVMDPANDNVCWDITGTHVLDVRCRVVEVSSEQKVVIGQIHGFSDKADPLIKLQFSKGRLEALVKDKARNGKDIKLTFTDVALGEDFDYRIKLQNGVLSVTVNGKTQSVNVVESDPAWAAETFYFKVGVYPQDNKGSDSEGARVSFSQLKVSHSRSRAQGE